MEAQHRLSAAQKCPPLIRCILPLLQRCISHAHNHSRPCSHGRTLTSARRLSSAATRFGIGFSRFQIEWNRLAFLLVLDATTLLHCAAWLTFHNGRRGPGVPLSRCATRCLSGPALDPGAATCTQRDDASVEAASFSFLDSPPRRVHVHHPPPPHKHALPAVRLHRPVQRGRPLPILRSARR